MLTPPAPRAPLALAYVGLSPCDRQMGLLLYDLATISLVLGLWAFFGVSVMSLVAPALVAYAWLNVNLQVSSKRLVASSHIRLTFVM